MSNRHTIRAGHGVVPIRCQPMPAGERGARRPARRRRVFVRGDPRAPTRAAYGAVAGVEVGAGDGIDFFFIARPTIKITTPTINRIGPSVA